MKRLCFGNVAHFNMSLKIPNFLKKSTALGGVACRVYVHNIHRPIQCNSHLYNIGAYRQDMHNYVKLFSC